MSSIIKPRRSGGVIGTIGPIGGSGVFSLQERHALSVDNYDDVSLYLKMNGASGSTTFYDSSQYGHTVTANGNAQISTAQSKFGGASAAFDGTGDYLEIPQNDATEIDGDGTVEAWIYLNEYETYDAFARGAIISNTNGQTSTTVQWSSFDVRSAGELAFSSRNFSVISSSGAVGLNQWHHVAACRSGSTLRLYVDGTQVASTTTSETLLPNNSGWSMRVGHFWYSTDPNRYFNGYIDDLRITKGVARYTGNFTPPQRDFLP